METPARSRAVLVTGCSSGIGRATALQLAAQGLVVYATARRPETLAGLEERGCRTLRLDVCDESSMCAAVERVTADQGAVGVLVNNAGYGLQGALEELPLEELRRQFETNLFGALRLAQLVLPGMRRQGWGRIVNVSSVGGRITTPGNGAYHASKHALEALSDVLRFEVRGFGVDVVVVEPAAIATRWLETAMGGLAAREDPGSPYAALHEDVAASMRGAHEGWLGLAAGSSEAVARSIGHAVAARRPRTRYVVPGVARLFVAAGRHLPARTWDGLMARMYRPPGAES
jgi:NAD(P)-dependent dehydrogenase (short-subunit alcohol dehydrogenase family)